MGATSRAMPVAEALVAPSPGAVNPSTPSSSSQSSGPSTRGERTQGLEQSTENRSQMLPPPSQQPKLRQAPPPPCGLSPGAQTIPGGAAATAAATQAKTSKTEVPPKAAPKTSKPEVPPKAAPRQASNAHTASQQSSLSAYLEPARKKPRLAAGEDKQWESEYEQLSANLSRHLQKHQLKPTSAQPGGKFTDEDLDKWEAYINNIIRASS